MSDNRGTSSSTQAPRQFDRWPKWSGNPSEFSTFLLSLEGISEDERIRASIGNEKAFCYGVFTYCLPPDAQKRVAPLIKERKKTNEWNIAQFIEHLEELFIDRDAASKAQLALNAIRQGPRQSFARFRSVFEQLCSEADNLAPTHSSKVSLMKSALVPSLRKGIAYRSNVSMTSYDLFVTEVQNLANELESLPDFQLARGSSKEIYIHENTAHYQQPYTPPAPAPSHIPSNNFQPNLSSPPAIYTNIDQDGDIKMGDISALQTQVQSLVAAISNLHANSNPNNRKPEHRPYPPECSQTERNRRFASGCCERCGRSPSHRWSDCSFRNFRNNPTSRGQGRPKLANVNSAISMIPENFSKEIGSSNSEN